MSNKRMRKRLDKLFTDIKEQESGKVEPKPKRTTRSTARKQAVPVALPQPAAAEVALPAETRPRAQPGVTRMLVAEPSQSFVSKSQSANAPAEMSIVFQASEHDWNSLQVIDETAARQWDPDEQLLVKQVVDQLTLSLQSAQLFQQTQRQNADLAILNDLARELSALLHVEGIAQTVYKYTGQVMDAANFFVALHDQEAGELDYPILFRDGRQHDVPRAPVGQGLTSQVIQTRQPVFLPDNVMQRAEDLGLGQADIGSDGTSLCWLGVPMILGQKVLGVIAVQSDITPRLYTERDRDLLIAIAGQAAIAFQNAQLFQQTQRQNADLAVLNEMGVELTTLLSITEVFEAVHRHLGRLMDATNFFAVLFDPVREEISLPIVIDQGRRIEVPNRRLGNGLTDYVLRNRRVLLLNGDVEAQAKVMGIDIVSLDDTQPAVSWLGVPLLQGQEISGALVIQSTTPGLFSDRERDLLTSVASQTAIALQNTRLFSQITSSEAQLSEALKISKLAYWEYDVEKDLFMFNDEFYSIFHTTAEREGGYQMPSARYAERFVYPDDLPVVGSEIEMALKSSDRHYSRQLDHRIQYADGGTGYISVSINIDRDEQGKILRYYGANQDITQSKLADEAIKEEQQRSQTILTTITVPMIISRLSDSIVLYANQALVDVGQVPLDALIGSRTVSYFVQPEDRNKVAETLRQQGFVSDFETQLVRGDGTPYWALLSSRIINYQNDVCVLSTYIDITERKLAEEAVRRSEEALRRQNDYLGTAAGVGRLVTSTLDLQNLFSRAVELMHDSFGFYHVAIFTLDESGFNAVLREGTGEAGREMRKRNHALAVGSRSIIGQVTSTGHALIANNTAIDAMYRPNPLLPDTRAEAGIPLRIGDRIMGALDIQSVDVEAFKSENVAVLEILADQIAVAIDNARSYDVSQKAVAEMRELDRIKTQFLANMSHELRTPLNSIIGFSRVILKGIDGPVTEQQQQDLSAIYSSGQHLLGLINDILDLSKIEAGKMELVFDEVNVVDTIQGVMSTAVGLVKDKQIRLLQEMDPHLPAVRADPMRIRQVLLNLLSNAAKFTDEGTITVSAQVHTSSDGQDEVMISVTDTGPGIAVEDQSKLFQPFSQVDSSPTRKTGGTGLGLSIAHRMIELHGGRIGVHSSPGKGSSFYFTIPVFQAEPVTPEIPEGAKAILCIDDDRQVINLYERYLKPQGYVVVPLIDPTRAVEMVRKIKPYAVTLDIMMPGHDGWQVINEIKADPETRDVPVIICSIVEEEEKGFSLGAADYLVKPILEDDLVNSLNRLNGDGSIHDVLIIDDDPNDLRLVEKIIAERSDFHPILAEGGEAGWTALTEKPPHAVILDLFMPGLDGFTILERLRANPTLRDVPVIVLSGADLDAKQKKKLDELGQRMLQKSMLNEKDLLTTLERALKRLEIKGAP